MIDKKDFEHMKSELEEHEKEKDALVRNSRTVVKLSKRVIYSLHRDDPKSAATHLEDMKKEFSNLDKSTKDTKLRSSGAYKVAVQEYVEAYCFYELIVNNRLLENGKLKLDYEYFLMGLIDLTGEVVRKAINASIVGKYEDAVKMKNLVSELYDELLLFDFPGGELRKKFDSVKYDLKKLDDLVLSLKLSNKI
jgi:predicted translin family RNA/ssDNA-binding protein